MEALLLRLTPGESEAETALRIIAYFDRLVEHGGDMPDLLRSAARLAHAAAGFDPGVDDQQEAFDSSGRRLLPAATPPNAATRTVPSEGIPASTVWLGCEADAAQRDLMLERMAIAACVIQSRRGVGGHVGQGAWPEQLLSHETSRNSRERSARALGLQVHQPARIAVVCGGKAEEVMVEVLGRWSLESNIRTLRPTLQDGLALTVVQGGVPGGLAEIPVDHVMAMGTASAVSALDTSYLTARHALRLTSMLLGPRAVDYDLLGPMRHLAEVDPQDAAETFEVAQLLALAQTEAGLATVKALDSFCRHGNLRAAAAELHLHHSSLANRITTVSRRLDLAVETPQGRLRAELALALFRVASWNSSCGVRPGSEPLNPRDRYSRRPTLP